MMNVRLTLVKLLMWLLGQWAPKSSVDIDREAADDFLARLHVDDGFRHFYRMRYHQLVKSIANGKKQEEYWQLCGQRADLLIIGSMAKQAYERAEKEKKKKKALWKKK